MVRKVSQSRQPKVGRLCTATKPSYPCHLRERHISLGRAVCARRLAGREKLPARPGCALPGLLPHPVGSLALCALPQASPASPLCTARRGHMSRAAQLPGYTLRELDEEPAKGETGLGGGGGGPALSTTLQPSYPPRHWSQPECPGDWVWEGGSGREGSWQC